MIPRVLLELLETKTPKFQLFDLTFNRVRTGTKFQNVGFFYSV